MKRVMAACKLYPKEVRKAIQKLTKVGLDFRRLNRRYARRLITYNLFSELPEEYYAFAKKVDINNIVAFNKEVVKLEDVKSLLLQLPTIPIYLADIVSHHKERLLLDGIIVDKLIESNMMLHDDVRTVLCNNVRTVVDIAVLNPDLVAKDTEFSLEDLISVLHRSDAETVRRLYERIDASIYSVLYMEREFSVVPAHKSLSQLTDIEEAIRLVKEYPRYKVIDCISESVKSNLRFLTQLVRFAKAALPEIYVHINKWLASVLSPNRLLSEFGIYFYVMFEWLNEPVHYNRELFVSLSDDEIKFIFRYFDKYAKKSEMFANLFRWYLHYRYDKLYPQKVFNTVTRSVRSPKIDEKRVYSAEKYLKYMGDIDTIAALLSDLRYNYSLGKRILKCDIDGSVKKEALKLLRKQTVCVSNSDCFEFGLMYSAIIRLNYASTKEAVYKTNLSDTLIVNKFYDLTDVGLLSMMRDISYLASKGIVDTSLLTTHSTWGPLMYLLSDACKIDFSKFVRALRDVNSYEVHCLDGSTDNAKHFKHVDDIDVYAMFDYEIINLYGLNFVKKVLLVNTVLEYVFVILTLRHKRQRYNIRGFFGRLLMQCLKGFGVSNNVIKNIYVSDLDVCYEMTMVISDGIVPYKAYNIVIKLLIYILDSLNGISKHSPRIRL